MLIFSAVRCSTIDCSNASNISVASFGEYVWNCSSTGGGGDVLLIMVPPPTPNESGMLSVEVRLSTFQEIIVDTASAANPQNQVNVTIVLVGAPMVNVTGNALNFGSRPLSSVIRILRSSAPYANLTTSFGVFVSVVVDSNVRLWVSNVSSFILVEPFPASTPQLLDVAVALRSGSDVELHDVPQFVLCDAQRTRLAMTAFNATILLSAKTLPVAASVVNIRSPGGGTAGFNATFTQCNITILQQQVLLGAAFLLLSGDDVSFADAALTFVRCHVAIPSPSGDVVAVRGDVTSAFANLSVALHNTTAHCGRSLVYVAAMSVASSNDVDVTVRSSNVSVSGAYGGLMFIRCPTSPLGR